LLATQKPSLAGYVHPTKIRRQFVGLSFALVPQPFVNGNARATMRRPPLRFCTVKGGPAPAIP
jgi:hypothetical protein